MTALLDWRWPAGIGLVALLITPCMADPGTETSADSLPGRSLVTVEIGTEILLADVPRLGVNLGHWTYWGAEQLSRNILKNPGFEGIIDRTLVRVARVGRHRFSDDQPWLARDDGFWSGAHFEILTGDAAGSRGRILDSRAADRDGQPEFIAESVDRRLAPGDIVALTRIRDDQPPTHWWLPAPQTGRVQVDPRLTAPGSPGQRSLALTPTAGATLRIASHLDTIGPRAGRLLPIDGPWRLALWLHAEASDSAHVRLLFRRHGGTPFVNLTPRLEPGWQYIEHLFHATDVDSTQALEFAIEVRGTGTVRVDDIWLGPWGPTAITDGPGANAFRPEVITLLQRLRPGYLRDWQGQLGDTLENRLATPWARRASRYRPGQGADYGYGLPEFLALARAVGANPWLIIPTTFSTDEARELGAWLTEYLDDGGFEEILIEFGNENWNAIFRPAGIQDPAHHGQAADRLFAALSDGAGGHPALRRVVNAQHANPWAAARTAAATTQADILAIAPYLLPRLEQGDVNHIVERLFDNDGGRLRDIADHLPPGLELAVYEVNLHTTRGDAESRTRAAATTGAITAAALAKRLIEAMDAGVRRQCVYRLTGFDTPLDDRSGLVPLFGITRDLTRDDRLRPTGWAVALLNQAISGNRHQVEITDGDTNELLIAAFRSEAGWSVAIVSTARETRKVALKFPDDGILKPSSAQVLDGSDPFLDNETSDQVRPRALFLERSDHDQILVAVPANSLAVLTTQERHR